VLGARVQRAATIADDDVADALGEHDLRAGHAGGARTNDHDGDVLGTRAAIRRTLSSAASTTIAVPCWSSWKTEMSSCLRSRRSISKQRGRRCLRG
jgi:hypothetical protein